MNKKYLYGGIAAFIVIMALIAGWTRLGAKGSSEVAGSFGSLNIPQSLAALPRTELISGPEAIKQISMMHGTEISFKEGYIAKYSVDGKAVMLWASVSPTALKGRQLYLLMDKKMPVSKVFTNRQEIMVNNVNMVKVLGMGQEHYYWVQGAYNYWVAVSGTEAVPVLQDALRKLE